ncbi:hypothetical protein M9H77_25910 [Catharanthus roseus]|uniref:Uncharacterized protein n=1 Tax=Catharanthus roseus TaxID=4058 RepID=A0ACC0A869_CATRO|nr:hypothetical protein M9H77_25910 [Catharanthus roseus]
MEQDGKQKQQQDDEEGAGQIRRTKLGGDQNNEGQGGPNQPPPPPQKCPRCDSNNTKFCYYNNYSLTQPRYFCKTCRRYWTQGGTLRNVPVGGGCRKGKRPKTSSSSTSSTTTPSSSSTGQRDTPVTRSSLPNPSPPPPAVPPVPLQQQLQLPPHLIQTISGLPTSQSLRNLGWAGYGHGHAPPPTSSLYHSSGGLLSSLTAMQSFNRPQTRINPPLMNLGGNSTGSNMPIFHGGGFNFPSTNSMIRSHQQQVQVQPQMHQSIGYQGMINDQDRDESEPLIYPPEQNLGGGQPSPAAATTTLISSWNNHGDNNNNANPSGSSSSLNFWNNSSGGGSASSGNPNQWPNLPGFGSSP